MPKKPNRTDMQEYVPAGNGDASGEYADEGGSNTHFTSFKKPDDPKPGDTLKPKDEPKIGLKAKPKKLDDDKKKTFDEWINSKSVSPSRRKFVKESFENGTPEFQTITATAIGKFDYSIKTSSSQSFYQPVANSLRTDASLTLNLHDLNDDNVRVKGETFYHEFGHSLDNMYCKDKSLEGYELSRTMKTKNGMTLLQTLYETDKKLLKSRFDEANKEYKSFANNWYKEHNYDYEGNVKKISSTREKIEQDFENDAKAKELKSHKYDSMDSFHEYFRYKEEFESNHPDLKGIYAKHKEMIKAMEYDKHKYFADISDMFGMSGVCNTTYPFGSGHNARYDKSQRGTEFFAECTSASAVCPESLSMIKKYFPEAYSAWEELMTYIKEQQK